MAIYNRVNIGSGNGLLPVGIKPLPVPMLTSRENNFTRGSNKLNPKHEFWDYTTSPMSYPITISFWSWWRHQMETLSALLALCAGNSPVLVNSHHKGQWRGALIFSFICDWLNGRVNNRDTGDLRRHRSHYDVIVIFSASTLRPMS